jgi:hypothetical protein
VLARGADLLLAGASLVEGEVDWAVDMEDALRLEDVLYGDAPPAEAALRDGARRALPEALHRQLNRDWIRQ